MLPGWHFAILIILLNTKLLSSLCRKQIKYRKISISSSTSNAQAFYTAPFPSLPTMSPSFPCSWHSEPVSLWASPSWLEKTLADSQWTNSPLNCNKKWPASICFHTCNDGSLFFQDSPSKRTKYYEKLWTSTGLNSLQPPSFYLLYSLDWNKCLLYFLRLWHLPKPVLFQAKHSEPLDHSLDNMVFELFLLLSSGSIPIRSYHSLKNWTQFLGVIQWVQNRRKTTSLQWKCYVSV